MIWNIRQLSCNARVLYSYLCNLYSSTEEYFSVEGLDCIQVSRSAMCGVIDAGKDLAIKVKKELIREGFIKEFVSNVGGNYYYVRSDFIMKIGNVLSLNDSLEIVHNVKGVVAHLEKAEEGYHFKYDNKNYVGGERRAFIIKSLEEAGYNIVPNDTTSKEDEEASPEPYDVFASVLERLAGDIEEIKETLAEIKSVTELAELVDKVSSMDEQSRDLVLTLYEIKKKAA